MIAPHPFFHIDLTAIGENSEMVLFSTVRPFIAGVPVCCPFLVSGSDTRVFFVYGNMNSGEK